MNQLKQKLDNFIALPSFSLENLPQTKRQIPIDKLYRRIVVFQRFQTPLKKISDDKFILNKRISVTQ